MVTLLLFAEVALAFFSCKNQSSPLIFLLAILLSLSALTFASLFLFGVLTCNKD